MTANARNMERRRTQLRDENFPGAASQVWNRREGKGFSTIPRLLPWIVALIRKLSDKKSDPSGVYWDLWCRVFDEGLVEVKDEEECAFGAGYTGQRAVRTWRERVEDLKTLGFIRVAPSGNRKIGLILIINPYTVVRDLNEIPGKIPANWWASYTARAGQIGADVTGSANTDNKPPSASKTSAERGPR